MKIARINKLRIPINHKAKVFLWTVCGPFFVLGCIAAGVLGLAAMLFLFWVPIPWTIVLEYCSEETVFDGDSEFIVALNLIWSGIIWICFGIKMIN